MHPFFSKKKSGFRLLESVLGPKKEFCYLNLFVSHISKKICRQTFGNVEFFYGQIYCKLLYFIDFDFGCGLLCVKLHLSNTEKCKIYEIRAMIRWSPPPYFLVTRLSIMSKAQTAMLQLPHQIHKSQILQCLLLLVQSCRHQTRIPTLYLFQVQSV